ncbi:M15 family metallopeptidase [Cyanobacteria bacterium FACHB-63]|nr:M15 family metallopeptidase [Cyanobacteria bacterium FACHB-63]
MKSNRIISAIFGTLSLLVLPGIAVKQAHAIDYTRSIPTPARGSINQNLTSPDAELMIRLLGRPGRLTENCSDLTNPQVKRLIVTKDVGPLKVTGLKPAIEALDRIFAQVKQDKPDLYKQIGTAGMLCVRKVRGGSNFSNHSWGTAIDIKINRELDERGDGKTQVGLNELYPYFHREGFYWGAGYSRAREDSMHFEASEELMRRWKAQNRI